MNTFDSESSRVSSSLAGALPEPPLDEAATPAWSERRSALLEWSLALCLALIAALLIRALFFEAFRIPSESMEDTLQVGDFVLVSKLHYGPRLPVTVGIPFTDLYLESVGLPVLRGPGFSNIQCNDVIVFNVPTEPYPIDRKTHYIKRVIGLPGDTIRIVDKVPYAGGQPVDLKPAMKQMWRARPATEAGFPIDRLQELGVAHIVPPDRRGESVGFEATAAVAAAVRDWPEVESVEAVVHRGGHRARIFPSDERGFGFDNYGPLYIPAGGDTLPLNDTTWRRYRDLIERYEGHTLRRIDDHTFEVDGQVTDRYVVEQDYYFVMGDNRDSSMDSRVWGFVPFDHVVGKAVLVYFSWDREGNRARFERFMKAIE